MFHPLQEFHAQFLVRHLPAAKPQGHLDPVAFLEKFSQLAQLDLVIADIRARTELDLLDLYLLLFLLGLLKFFAFLKPKFAVVHDPANGRLRIGRDLNEIKFGLFGQPVRLFNGNYTKLFTVIIDNPYLGRSNGLVDAMLRFFCSYALSLQNSTAAARDLDSEALN
jgi:hypothetical protein